MSFCCVAEFVHVALQLLELACRYGSFRFSYQIALFVSYICNAEETIKIGNRFFLVWTLCRIHFVHCRLIFLFFSEKTSSAFATCSWCLSCNGIDFSSKRASNSFTASKNVSSSMVPSSRMKVKASLRLLRMKVMVLLGMSLFFVLLSHALAVC